mmetsp:Transcript_15027/g.33138  ORF Transcript_15027/g.33138 Transcript_15027/m.33138 type:complete len:258 (-) Transcript_15027:399-1172(-)
MPHQHGQLFGPTLREPLQPREQLQDLPNPQAAQDTDHSGRSTSTSHSSSGPHRHSSVGIDDFGRDCGISENAQGCTGVHDKAQREEIAREHPTHQHLLKGETEKDQDVDHREGQVILVHPTLPGHQQQIGAKKSVKRQENEVEREGLPFNDLLRQPLHPTSQVLRDHQHRRRSLGGEVGVGDVLEAPEDAADHLPHVLQLLNILLLTPVHALRMVLQVLDVLCIQGPTSSQVVGRVVVPHRRHELVVGEFKGQPIVT